MGLGVILLLGGLAITAGLILWALQRQRLGYIPEERGGVGLDLPPASGDAAVLITREHGQLVFASDRARRWIGMNGGEPNLEFIAQLAQPAENFLELFHHEGQASFQLGSRWVEATSHTIPSGSERRTIVVMRELNGGVRTPESLDLSAAMATIHEIGETVNASMSLEQLLQTLLTIVFKALPASAGEICLWDDDRAMLHPRGWVGDTAYLLAFSEAGGVYAPGEGITGWIAKNRKPALVTDVDDVTAIQPKLSGFYRSFIGVPLVLGERFIGTLEMAHRDARRFDQGSLALLQAISKPVATAIYNAELYGQQARRIQDIAALHAARPAEAATADPRQVYALLTERIARLVNATMCGVLLYDEDRQALIAELPFFGLPDYAAQNYTIALPPGSRQRDIWENQTHWMTNDAPDEGLIEDLGLKAIFVAAGIRSMALIPMQIGAGRIGMIQVSNKRAEGGFTPQDIQDLRVLVTQAAVVVEEVRLYQRQQRQDTELVGLQEMTHAIGALSQEGEFYSTITERIARLMGISMCGVLLWDEPNQCLVPQFPFFGIENSLIENYVISLPAGSPLYTIWQEEDYWFTNRVQSDAVVHAAGLADFANAVGVTKTLFTALAVGGRRLGAVQVSNKLNGEDFTDKDARLMMIFAAQTAAIIENARLYRDIEQRAKEAERLRDIAEMAGGILTEEDSFQGVLAAIAELMESRVVFVNVIDEPTGSLVTYPRLVYGADLPQPLVQNLYGPDFESSVALSHEPLLSNDAPNDRAVPDPYRQVAKQFGLSGAVLVPVVVGERGIGELGIANRAGRRYDDDDARLLIAVATQIAAAIERIRLYEAAEQNLERRIEELDAISRISHELTQTLELDPVLDVIRREAARATLADGGTVVLLQPPDRWHDALPVLERRIGAGADLADIEVEAVLRGSDTVLVRNYAADPLLPAPDSARSAIAAAFLYEDRVVGVVHVYHTRQKHFDERTAAFLMTIAAKASLAYGNYRRYQEQLERSTRLRRRVEQLNQIFELGRELQTSVEPEEMLEAILDGIQQSVGFEVAVASLVDEDDGMLRRVAQAGMPLDAFDASRAHALPLDAFRALLRDDYHLSESYFFPAESRGGWSQAADAAFSTDFEGRRPLPDVTDDRGWRDGDRLILPLASSVGDLLGAITLDGPLDGSRPDRAAVEILEIFAHQAATTLENNRLYQTTLDNAEQEARLNAIMEAVSRTLDTGQIIEAVAFGVAGLLPLNQMTVALMDAEQQGYDVLQVTLNTDTMPVMLKEHRDHLDGTALARTIRDGQDHLYDAGEADAADYGDLQAWRERGARTALVVPLIAGGATLGAMHLGSEEAEADSFHKYRSLLKRMANLSAVAIENARLFNRALNLQGFNESVVESIQQGIIVLDKSGRILSINDYMHQRYGWQADAAVSQDLFAYSPELMILADHLRVVLDEGTPREQIWQHTTEGDRLLVRNFYLYPLRSAEGVRGAVVLVEDVTERALLERDIEGRANQLAALTEVSSRITASLNRDEVINLALVELRRIIPYDTLTLWSRSGDSMTLDGYKGFHEQAVEPGTAAEIPSHERLRIVVETQRPYAINNLQHLDHLPGEKDVSSWMGVPLVNQGYVVGMIGLAKAEPHFYLAPLQQAAFAFANQMAVALANADLYAESQRRTERLSLLNRVSVALAQSLDSENILETALREIAGVMGVDHGRALLIERELQIGRVIVKYPRGDAPPDEVVKLVESAIYQRMRRVSAPITFEDVNGLTRDDPVLIELGTRGIGGFAVIPMTVGGQVIGTFELESLEGARRFASESIELGQIIANQAAIAVQNTSLLEQTLVRTRELETLLEAAQATSLTLNLDEVFQSVVALMLHALDMDDCAVMLWDNIENALEVEVEVNRSGDPHRTVPHGTTYDLRAYPARLKALEDREVIAIRAESSDADAAELHLLRQNGDQLRVLIPLVVRDQAIGLVQVETQAPHRAFGHREMRLAQALGSQAAIAIQNARLSTETAALVEEGFVVNNLSQAISATLTVDDIITIVREQIPRVTDAEEMYLALYDAEAKAISFPVVVSRDGSEYAIPARSLGTDEVSYVIKHRRSLPLGGGNWSSDEMRRNLGISNGEGAAKSYLGVPIIAGDQVLGVLAARDLTSARAFGINDERLLTTVGAQLGAAIQNARLFEQVTSFASELNERVQERTRELQERSAELQHERDRIDTLYRITSDLATTLDMDRVLRRALELVAGAVVADDGVILLVDPLTENLYSRAQLYQAADGGSLTLTHPAEGLARWLIQSGSQHVVVDELRGQDYWEASGAPVDRWHSAAAVLLENNDDVHGVMVLLSETPGVFAEAQTKLIIAAANQVAAAIYNAELYHLIRDQAERLGVLVRQEREETEKSNAIVEGIADGVMLADANGVIVLFNSAAEHILDLPRENVVGQAIFKLTGLFGESAALWARAIEEWALDPERHQPGDFLAETLDLGKRVVSVHLSPVHISDRFLGTVSVFRDITKEVEVDRIKSEFVSNVSHELRTPMTSIKGFADLLLLGVVGELTDQQRGFLQKINANADRLGKLVDDLLNISRIDAGERLSLELVDVARLIKGVVATLKGKSHHERKDLQVSVEVPESLPMISADPHKLTQIMTNLVDNAFNYTYPGGSIELTAAMQPDEKHVLISIRDTGIGIPEEFRSRIWQRFERYDSHALVMDVAGTGLGLSIVRELVEMHGGEVWFESETDKGTTFFVSLPVSQPETH